MSGASLPNFLIIGAQKSATRWLRTNLGQHPNVFTASTELEYFNHNWNKNPSWYREQFQGAAGFSAVGEATPGYMMWNEDPGRQAARIDGLLPEVRLLAILRNPIERSYSGFIHFMKEGRIAPETSLMEYVNSVSPEKDPCQIIAGSWYGASLQPYVERFEERLLVLQQDELKLDPIGVYRRALRHLGVVHNFVPQELRKVRHSNQAPGGNARSTDGEGKALGTGERRKLLEYFHDDLERLADLEVVDVSDWKL